MYAYHDHFYLHIASYTWFTYTWLISQCISMHVWEYKTNNRAKKKHTQIHSLRKTKNVLFSICSFIKFPYSLHYVWLFVLIWPCAFAFIESLIRSQYKLANIPFLFSLASLLDVQHKYIGTDTIASPPRKIQSMGKYYYCHFLQKVLERMPGVHALRGNSLSNQICEWFFLCFFVLSFTSHWILLNELSNS